MNTENQISRAEKTSEEKNQDHEMQRKQKKRREIADSIRREEQEKKRKIEERELKWGMMHRTIRMKTP